MSVKGGEVIFQFKPDDKDLQKSVNDMGTSIKKMVTALGLDKLISKTMSALNNSLDGAIKRVDTLNNFPRVMSNLGIATEEATEAVNELSDGLTGLPTTLNDGVSAVQRFTSQNNDVKKSTKIFLALNNAILAGGASTEVQASAMEQLSQAYAKGKPDAMEWRSMLTAMPAQLKQVAKAMGYTSTAVGGDLYTAIQKGKVSMDDFMDTIVKLNTEGVGEFASFEEQAKASTGGIATSITNVKTAITRGLANSIEALNKALKKVNLPTVSEMIQNFGKTISKAFSKVNEAIGKINFQKLIPVFKEVLQYFKNLKDTALGFVKDVFKKIDWNMVLQIAPTVLKIVGTIKVLNPLIKTGTSLISGFSKVISGLSSPVGIVTAVITGLATALVFLTTNQTESQKETAELCKRVRNLKQETDEYSKSLRDNASNELAHIDKTKQLSDELKTLVDENGKVKEGYKDRVQFILGQLNEALDTEYKLNGNIIERYQDIQTEIDKTIEKKKAEIKLNVSREEYKKAIEQEAEATKNLDDVLKKLGISYDEAKWKVSYWQRENEKGRLSIQDLGKEELWLIDAFDIATKQIEDSTSKQKQYVQDETNFAKGAYDEVGKSITLSTQNWTDATEQEIKDNIKTQEEDLKRLEDLYANTGNEIYKQQVEDTQKSLANLRGELSTRTGIISAFTPQEVQKWITLAQNDRNAFNSEMSKTSGDTRNQLQTIANVIDQNGHIPENEMREVAQYISAQFTGLNSWSWGADMVQGIINGINNKKAAARQVANQLASIIASPLHFSRPDEGALRNYEKWMPDFVQGLKKTLEASTPNLYGAISKMAGKMKDQISLGLGMSPTLNNTASYNPSVNVTVYNNMETDFMGNLVSNIKTFSNGSKNDYNYGMGG
jgi:tape measure domain-containing protein